MKPLKTILIGLLMLLLLITCFGCGGGSSKGPVKIKLLPYFGFNGISATSFKTKVVMPTPPPDPTAITNQFTYYLCTPALVGFNSNTSNLKNGDSYTTDFLGQTLTVNISISNNEIIYTGTLADGSGTILVTVDTTHNTFSYDQYIVIQDEPGNYFLGGNKYAIVYFTFNNVLISSQGYFHAVADLMVLEPNNTFATTCDFYSGLGFAGHDLSPDHKITGGYLYSPVVPATQPSGLDALNPLTITKATFLSYFIHKSSWTSSELSDSLFYYDYDLTAICSNTGATPTHQTETTPWVLLTVIPPPATNPNFIIVGDDSTIFTSADGISWSKCYCPPIDPDWTYIFRRVVYGNGRYVVADWYDDNRISTNGINWDVFHVGYSCQFICGIAFGNDVFVCLDDTGEAFMSSDGINWTQTKSYNGKFEYANQLIYANGMFVGVGCSWICTSTDGITWTDRSKAGYGLLGVTYGNGQFVAVGCNNGQILTSSDGINWTDHSKAGYELYGVTYGDGKYIAVGANGAILVSTDRVNWDDHSHGSTCLRGGAYHNGKYVVIGDSGKILVSTDGINWTDHSKGSNDLYAIL